jgi:predicted RNA-binding Zn-ribbon protein involved in translation (DUF1610 family)
MNTAQIKYQERTKHPCLDCGRIIHRRSTRCADCAHKARKTVEPKYCMDCGKPISGWTAKRCPKCNRVYLLSIGRMKPNPNRGKEHHNWKGGVIRSSGYVFIHKPDHPRANRDGYVREHILVWEETHDKPLPKGWIVHHLNGVKSDNRPQNLLGLPNRKHYLVLQAKAKRIQELEALLNGQSQLL